MDTSQRLGHTIIIGVVWVAFTVLVLAVNPAKLGIWQNIAAVLSTGIVAVGAVALTWIRSCI